MISSQINFYYNKEGDKVKSFYLNQAGDLELDKLNNIKLIDGKEEIDQRTRLTLSTNQGEWFLNLNFGIPWIELLGQKNTQQEIKYEIIKALSQDEDIKSVDWVDFDYDGGERDLIISFKATLVDGSPLKEKVEVM